MLGVVSAPASLEEADSSFPPNCLNVDKKGQSCSYRRLHALVRREGVQANHKRIYRLYSDAGLSVRRRERQHGVAVERQELECPSEPNQVWSMDFVSDALANGRWIKVLTIVDDFSKEATDLAVAFAISGHYVTRILDQTARLRG